MPNKEQNEFCLECDNGGIVEVYCEYCNGSGEGSAYNTVCPHCGGYGSIASYCSCKKGVERRERDYK